MESTASTPRLGWRGEQLALIAEVLRDDAGLSRHGSGIVRMRVYGESMLPALWPGDLVEIASCSLDEVRPGEIVLAERDGRFFLHRFVGRCGADGFLMRGDSMPEADPEFPAQALLGRLVGEARASRAKLMTTAIWSRAAGIVLGRSAWARRFALKLHRRRQEIEAQGTLRDDRKGRQESSLTAGDRPELEPLS